MANRTIDILLVLFDWAVEEKRLLTRSPYPGVKSIMHKRVHRHDRYLLEFTPARCRGVSAKQASLPPSRHDRRCGRCRLSMAIRHYLGIAKKAEFSDEVLARKREQALKRLGVGEPILRCSTV
jgi:hypothetical protein